MSLLLLASAVLIGTATWLYQWSIIKGSTAEAFKKFKKHISVVVRECQNNQNKERQILSEILGIRSTETRHPFMMNDQAGSFSNFTADTWPEFVIAIHARPGSDFALHMQAFLNHCRYIKAIDIAETGRKDISEYDAEIVWSLYLQYTTMERKNNNRCFMFCYDENNPEEYVSFIVKNTNNQTGKLEYKFNVLSLYKPTNQDKWIDNNNDAIFATMMSIIRFSMFSVDINNTINDVLSVDDVWEQFGYTCISDAKKALHRLHDDYASDINDTSTDSGSHDQLIRFFTNNHLFHKTNYGQVLSHNMQDENNIITKYRKQYMDYQNYYNLSTPSSSASTNDKAL